MAELQMMHGFHKPGSDSLLERCSRAAVEGGRGQVEAISKELSLRDNITFISRELFI